MGELEDALIRKILAVSFSADQANATAKPPVLLLAGLAEVIEQLPLTSPGPLNRHHPL